MVIGKHAKCATCDHLYLIRYNLGNAFPQSASFKCKTCGEFLKYGYDSKREEILGNIKIVEGNYSEGTVQNLHPELPIDPERASERFYFPSPEFIMRVDGGKNENLTRFRAAQKSMVQFKSALDEFETDFRYLKEKRWSQLEKNYGKNKDKAQKEVLKDALKVGRLYLEGHWHQMYRDALSQLEDAKRHANYQPLKQYLESRKVELLIDKMYEVFNIYRKAFDEMLPALLSQKLGMMAEGNSSSPHWEKIEMLYGGLYEIYGDLLVLPTAINNLLSRNNYQLFASFPNFTFSDYLDSDKAGRTKNFASNARFLELIKFYDPGLRNATYHKASSTDKDNQEIILKTGKGGKTEKRISLMEYITHCNELFARCLVLFNLMYKAVH